MSSRSCLSVKNDPYITKLGELFGLSPVLAHAKVGTWMELNNSLEYPTKEQFEEYISSHMYQTRSESQNEESVNSNNKYYEGDVKPEPNTVFVFGSNPEGRHGLGAAKVARQQFGAIYGQGEGLQGNAYALPTKDLRVKENRGLKSISPEQITENIKTLYEVARQNPDKEFKVAYRNTTDASYNGYTGLEMIEMFNDAGAIPSNVIFSKEWFDTGRLNTRSEITSQQQAQQAPKTPESNSLGNAVLKAQERLFQAYDAVLREEMAEAIGELFIGELDQLEQDSIEEGNRRSRPQLINEETAAGVFATVKGFLEYGLENPSFFGWTLENTESVEKALDYFYDLARLSTRYISEKEGINFSLNSKNSQDSSGVQIDPETGSEENYNTQDPLSSEEQVKEYWITKNKHLSAKENLSKEVRSLLKSIPKLDANGNQEKNILGMPKNLNSDIAHSALIDLLSLMVNARDLMPLLEEMATSRPWVNGVLDAIKNDKKLQSKFYKNFRKDFNFFSIITRMLGGDGRYKYKSLSINKLPGADFLLNEWQENYESGTSSSQNPIYDSNNRIVEKNVSSHKEAIADMQKSFREHRKANGRKALADGQWVADNIDDLVEILHAIGVTLTKDLILGGLNAVLSRTTNSGFSIPHPIEPVLNRLTEMFNIIESKKIGFNKEGEKEVVDWRKTFSNAYTLLAKTFQNTVENPIEASSRENNASYYAFLPPNYINKLIKSFKVFKGERFANFITEQFGRYHQFYDFAKGELRDGWVKTLNDNQAARDMLQIKTLLNYNKVNYSDLSDLDYTSAMLQMFFNKERKTVSDYHMPILSDSPTGLFITFERFPDGLSPNIPMVEIGKDDKSNPILKSLTYKEHLLNKFVVVAQLEYDRIQLVRSRNEALKDSNSLKPIANFDTVGANFLFFPRLNDVISEIDALNSEGSINSKMALLDLYKKVIDESIDAEFAKALERYKEIGLFEKTEGGEYVYLDFNTKSEAEVNANLENYFWNSAYATSLIIQMTTGDLSFYKNIEDFLKRNKQVYSPGERLNTLSEYGKEFQKTVIIDDAFETSNAYLNIQEALRASGAPISQIKEIMSSYVVSEGTDGANQTDGLAFSSLNAFRAMEDMAGDWTDAKQALYDKLIAHSRGKGPKFTLEDFDKLTQLQTKKPFTFTFVHTYSGMNDSDGNPIYIKRPFLNKNSHYLITIAGLMAKSPLMTALNEFMMKHDIDVVQFNSSVKVGNLGSIDISEATSHKGIVDILERNTGLKHGENNEQLYNQTVHVIPYEDFAIQQPVDDHITDSESLFGTLVRKIAPTDLPDNPNFKVKVNDKSYTKEEWLKLYNDLIVENLIESFMDVRSMFSTNLAMEEVLLSEIASNSRYSRDLEAAVTLDENGNFPIPLYEPSQSILILQLLSSIVKNRITKLKIKGGQLVHLTNFGFTEDLSVRFLDSSGNLIPTFKEWSASNRTKGIKEYKEFLKDKQHSLAHVEAYLPAYSESFVRDYMDPNTGEININNLPEDLRKMIGYRIPTEAAYSIIPIYIKGFLPLYAGTLIMLPSEITSIAGLDFDVDKLYMMIPEFKRKASYSRGTIKKMWDNFYSDPANSDIVEEIDKNTWKAIDKYIEEETADWDSDPTVEEITLLTDEFFQWMRDSGTKKREFSETAQLRFSKWLSENRDNYKQNISYEKIKYNDLLEAKDNGLQARNNLLIDMIWGVMTTPEKTAAFLNPLSFDILKKASRIIQILKNTTNKLLRKILGGEPSVVLPKKSLQELEDIAAEFRKSPNMLNPITQVLFHQQNMIAAKIIGIAANHNANHSLMQLTKIAFSELSSYLFDGNIYRSLHGIVNNIGEYISRNVSGYLAASVDAAKDPILGDLNLNTFTSDVVFLQARLGHSVLSTSLFLALPIIIEMTNNYNNNKGKGKSRDALIKSFINEYKKKHQLAAFTELESLDITQEELFELMLADQSTGEFRQKQYEIALKFTEMLGAADVLASLTSATRADTSNGALGPSFAHTETKINKLVDYYTDNNIGEEDATLEEAEVVIPFIDLEEGGLSDIGFKNKLRDEISNSILPMLQAFHTLGLESSERFMKKFFPHFRKDFRHVMNSLRSINYRNSLMPETMNKIYADLFAYIASSSDFFSGITVDNYAQKFEYITKDFVSNFAELKISGKYDNNEFVKHLSILNPSEKNPTKSIIFKNVGALSPAQKLKVMDGWSDLMYQGEEGYNLAKNLFLYSYFRNGFNFGPQTFIHLASTLLKVNIKDYTSALENINEIQDNAEERYNDFIDQFLLNRSNLTELVPRIDNETSFEKQNNDGSPVDSFSILYFDRADYFQADILPGDALFLIAFRGKRPYFKPYVTIGVGLESTLYRNIGIFNEETIDGTVSRVGYVKVKKLGYPNQYLLYLYGEKGNSLTEILPEIVVEDLFADIQFAEDIPMLEQPDDFDRRTQDIGFKSLRELIENSKIRSQEAELEKLFGDLGLIEKEDAAESFNEDVENFEEEENRDITSEERNMFQAALKNAKGKKMFSLLSEIDRVLKSIGGYGRDGNYRRYKNVLEAEAKVKAFNTKHPLRNLYVASTVKGVHSGPDNYVFYRLLLKPRTALTQIESKRISFDRELNLKIRQILEGMGVSIGALDTLEQRLLINGVMDTSQANNVVDGMVELIRLAKGERGEMALPEEFAHFALEALGDNPIVDRLMTLINNNNFVLEILADRYEAYYDKYNGDSTLMAKEAIGQLLAKHFLQNQPKPHGSRWNALFNRIVDAIKSFWSKLSSTSLTRARMLLNSEFAEVAEGLIEGLYNSVMSVDNIRNADQVVQMNSLGERVSRDRELLLRMVEQENKLLYATTRETSFDKDAFKSKELIKKLDRRLERNSNIESLLGITEYVEGALNRLKEVDAKMILLLTNKEDISNPAEALSILRDAYYIFTAYLPTLKEVEVDLAYSNLEGIERFDNKVSEHVKLANSIILRMQEDYDKFSIELFAKFLEPLLGPNIKQRYQEEYGKELNLENILKKSEKDISFLSRWLESMSRINDLPSQLIDGVVKKQENDARLNAIEVGKLIESAHIKLEKSGIKNTDWMFVKDENGVPTGQYIGTSNSVAYEEAKTKKRNEVNAKYKGDMTINGIFKREKEFNEWVADNTVKDKGIQRPDPSIYPSEGYASLNDALKDYYNTFMSLKANLDSLLPFGTTSLSNTVMVRKDFMERMAKSGSVRKGAAQVVESIKDSFMRRTDDADFGDYKSKPVTLDFLGNEIMSLPIFYVLSLEDLNSMSVDATSSLIAYGAMVHRYNAMNKVIDALEVGKGILKQREVVEREGGSEKIERIKHMGRDVERQLFKRGDGTRLFLRINDYYSMQVYGRYIKDQGNIKGTKILKSKVADFINRATSATSMWLNPFIGTTNILTGIALTNIELLAQEHFSAKELAKADLNYSKDLSYHLAQAGKRVKTSKLHLVNELFDATQDSEVRLANSNMDKRNIFSRMMSMETLYFFSTSGEHWMHMRTLLSIMEQFKVLDPKGEEVGLYDALEAEYINSSNPNEGARLVFKPGYKKLDGSTALTNEDIVNIKNRTNTINQDLHGVYNKIDKDAFQALAEGRLIEMYRKWMTRSVTRRYGAKKYVVELDQEVEGFYRTMGQYMLNIAKDMKRFLFFTATLRFKDLSPHQKANMKRALVEMSLALAISLLLNNIDWDDDEDTWAKNALEFQLRRFRTELLSPMPFPQGIPQEGLRILQSPMAGMSFINNVIDLLRFMQWTDRVPRGRYKDRMKIERDFMELLPMNKTIYGVMHPEERLLFYKKSM